MLPILALFMDRALTTVPPLHISSAMVWFMSAGVLFPVEVLLSGQESLPSAGNLNPTPSPDLHHEKVQKVHLPSAHQNRPSDKEMEYRKHSPPFDHEAKRQNCTHFVNSAHSSGLDSFRRDSLRELPKTRGRRHWRVARRLR